MPVALGQPLGRALVGCRAEHPDEFGFDQRPVDRLGGLEGSVTLAATSHACGDTKATKLPGCRA
jgi:hypothetical protein